MNHGIMVKTYKNQFCLIKRAENDSFTGLSAWCENLPKKQTEQTGRPKFWPFWECSNIKAIV